MTKLDFAMLATRSPDGTTTARPMSNSSDVEYSGDSWFFAYDHSCKIADIEADPHVLLSYTGPVEMLGGPPLFVAVKGEARLIQDRTTFEDHWTKDLD